MNEVRMIGKFNLIFCILVGNDFDIVSLNIDLNYMELNLYKLM